ncbi:lipase family [Brachionus plicatilis]|uniref:Lipase family n=1 Tax=Brachionus plicatilis TaxID=10195 RepID=A0A3M7QY59_BRAPC|nr:lipase family [Brachionus plicatilis]
MPRVVTKPVPTNLVTSHKFCDQQVMKQNEVIKCNVIVLGHDCEQSKNLVDFLFQNNVKDSVASEKLCEQVHKHVISSQQIDLYTIGLKSLNERKFFNLFNQLLENELSNRIDYFVLHERLDEFLLHQTNNIFKLLLKYFDLKFNFVIFRVDEEIFDDKSVVGQFISAKKDQLKNYLDNEAFYGQVEITKDENLCLDTDHLSLLQSTLAQTNPHYYCLKSSLEQVNIDHCWLNMVDLDFGPDFEIDLNECTLFCDCSKKNKFSKQIIEKNNWIFLSDKEERGYYAVTFYKQVRDKTVVVMSHRGTKLNKLTNILYDLEIVLQIEPDVLKKAISYENKVLDELGSKINSVILIHVGFSLGGYLAASCATRDFRRKYVTKYAVTFDAPGILFDSHKQVKNSENIVNYFVMPNLVNTCNYHVGNIYQISANIKQPNENVKICLSTLKSLPTEIMFLSVTHDLDFFMRQTAHYNTLRKVKQWPVAANKIFAQKISHKRSNQVLYE